MGAPIKNWWLLADCENQQCYKKEKQQIFNKIIYNKLQLSTIIVFIILQSCFIGVSSIKWGNINFYEIGSGDLKNLENVTVNSNVLITCKYSYPSWHKNGIILEANRLYFPEIKKYNAGEYGCKPKNHTNWANFTLSVFDDNDSHIIQSSSSKITLNKSLPKCKNMSILNEIYRTEGQNIHLKCDCTDSPMPNITWTKNDIRLKNAKFRGYFVKLYNIQESDAGRYSCNVCNHVGCIEHPVAFLYIGYALKKMKIQSQLSEKILTTGSDGYLKNDEDIDIDEIQKVGQANIFNNEKIGHEDEENDNSGDGGDDEDDEIFNSNTETTILLNQTPTIASTQLPEGLPRFIKSYDFNKIYSKPSGSMVKMGCPSEGNPMPNITWTKGGAAISRSMGEVKTYKWNIVLEDLNPKDSGQYTCIVCNRFGCINFTSDLSVAVILNKSLPKCKNMSILNEIYHTEGETVRLKCDCRDSPMPNITWIKNDIRLKNGKFRGYSVKLNNIQESDAGRYSCNVCNQVGCIEHPIAFLNIGYVLKNMEIQSQLPEKILSTGSDVGYLKNDEDIIDIDEIQKDGQANIFNNEKIGHEDEENDNSGDGSSADAGDDEHDETFNLNTETTILYNHQKPNRSQNHNQTPSIAIAQLPEGLPRFIKSYNFNKIYSKPLGSRVKMGCPSEGNPEPNITWTKDGAAISRSMGEVKPYKWNIVLKHLVPKDSGQYTCIVCNRFGCINFTSDLSVAERYPGRPFIQEGFPKNVTALENAAVKFKCPILADLNPQVKWYKYFLINDTTVPPANITTLQTKENRTEELILENITHEMEGWYTCVATNSLGFSTAKAYLTVVDKIDKEQILIPNNSNQVFTIGVVTCFATFIIIVVAIM